MTSFAYLWFCISAVLFQNVYSQRAGRSPTVAIAPSLVVGAPEMGISSFTETCLPGILAPISFPVYGPLEPCCGHFISDCGLEEVDVGMGAGSGVGPGMGVGPIIGVGPGMGVGPVMGVGPGMGVGPAIGMGPEMGADVGTVPGMGVGPEMGVDVGTVPGMGAVPEMGGGAGLEVGVGEGMGVRMGGDAGTEESVDVVGAPLFTAVGFGSDALSLALSPLLEASDADVALLMFTKIKAL